MKRELDEEKYKEYVQNKIPKPNYIKNSIWAFFVGGIICTFAQFVLNMFKNIGLDKKEANTATVIVMVFLGAFLTGLGVYDKIGKRAGAGSIVPITGFANSIVSPAMEFKREGYVFGVGAKMFSLAGPVLVYGFSSSVIIGLLYFFLKK
ncbi:stage V sporulation protein AC [Caminicella sporogenes DSM 14501]|uniref:Stage V sporulation protein AC n=1 Tax=Caminicella sporogenes DSM 14501 TaxID=1121266 RepID=A0A1M6T7P1_9FIRM|nr:stage V sporulation protein AC [Caminicella sporogenes]RKD26078.1 stage V sporulation protein AC [Caminicella sporogenes]WIF94332.1 stage V sporulation protein AC [Caminicella sporogenes]SHK52960.1 stage V sporulation protein AC [Caminicella sporogenes DSM 14501]